jgi:hypothetical protein
VFALGEEYRERKRQARAKEVALKGNLWLAAKLEGSVPQMRICHFEESGVGFGVARGYNERIDHAPILDRTEGIMGEGYYSVHAL